MFGQRQKRGRKEHDEKSGGQIKDDQSDQERTAKLQDCDAECRKHHNTVHDEIHETAVMAVEQKSGGKSAAGEQDARPLPDIHRPVRMTERNGVVQRAENAGHEDDEQNQKNQLRPGIYCARHLRTVVCFPVTGTEQAHNDKDHGGAE